MKILPFALAATLASAALAQTDSSTVSASRDSASAPTSASAASPVLVNVQSRIIVNGFRMPSIGLEYQRKSFSWHAGMYCTVISKDEDGDNETTWFGRGGMTWWPWRFLFVDASYLYGLNHNYKNDHAFMLNPGLQDIFWDTLVLRLGVAVLASPDHAYRINPTPGIGIAFTL